MRIHNSEIAKIFYQVADLLEIKGENRFKVLAYRSAAKNINLWSDNLYTMLERHEDLTKIPGVGKELAKSIETIIKIGKLPYLETLEKQFPTALSELFRIEGLGPSRIRILFEHLNIKNIQDLEAVINTEKIKSLPRFGEKLQDKIRLGLEQIHQNRRKWRYWDVFLIAQSMLEYLKKSADVELVEYAGSFRRKKDVIGDLDFVVATQKPKKVSNYFSRFAEHAIILDANKAGLIIVLPSGLKMKLHLMSKKRFGAALLYYTGSRKHINALQNFVADKNLTIKPVGKTETEFYKKLNLEFIEPELRENRGEIEAAEKYKLPKLIKLKHMRGDLHCHTTATDGKNSMEEMVAAAEAKGYEYVAITDHTKRLAMVRGLDEKRLLAQIKMIDKLNNKFNKIVILKGSEVDILEDGSLDLPNYILKELDVRVCSLHSKLRLPEKEQTQRIIRAMDNPYFNILGHPTGRILYKRPESTINMEKIIQAAIERNCFFEINSQPSRMDLNDEYIKMAKDLGAKFAISTDAHSIKELEFMPLGINQARRGWLEKKDVINTYSLQKLKQILKRS